MFKYKWDGIQTLLVICFAINALALLVFPYKYNSLTEATYFGYKAFLHWVIIFYSARITLHVFGLEIYNIRGNILGLYAILIGSTYFKFFLGRRPDMEIMYSGMIIPVVTLSIFVAVLLADKLLYVIEKKEI